MAHSPSTRWSGVTVVFVSHSGRDNATQGDPDEEVRRLRMRGARDGIVRVLRDLEYKVWLDCEQLEPGIEWDDAILCGVTDCDFAVVLLDKATVADPGYVLKEATILAYRSFLEPEFRFVTVALDKEVDRLLATERTWKSVNIRRWQSISAGETDIPQLVAQFAEWADCNAGKLAAGVGNRRARDQTDELVAGLLCSLCNDSPLALDVVVNELDLFDSRFTKAHLQDKRWLKSCAHQMSARILASHAKDIPGVLNQLPSTNERVKLGNVLCSNWVALDAAASISVARSSPHAIASLGIAGPWHGDVSFAALAGDLIDRSRRTEIHANYRLVCGEVFDEETAEEPAAFAWWIQQQIEEDLTEGTSASVRELQLTLLPAHLVVRAATQAEMEFFVAAFDLLPECLRQHLTFVVLVEPCIDSVALIDQSVADSWAYRKMILNAAKMRNESNS